ncbi:MULTISPECIES: helix-turn-helix domain-containing protein [Clostridioides]|uniref:helix-turn-helix domain-containing protein n=1 Tax=Clostridioides sp. ZZV14-6387 TaxID=2811497 RepID=UPI0006BBAC00|nr:transcriptional regulator [Clostridioides difficile]MCC0690566.1 helix-turn-helix domain-containing protein [Clostridioides sp. ZZV14-6387]NJJ37086.1 helix-turn-helix domain-containing protein [Clostridioides difficile]NJK12992.1 helix-turn-helix domain-containing protein [Clostridioides difficile]
MNLKDFNGKRLKSARVFRAKTIEQLAKETKINKKDLKAFEENKYIPNMENTLKLSNILNFPKEYFYKHENMNVIVEDSHFNPQSKLPRVEEISYREKMIIIHKIYSFMESYIKFPKENLPSKRIMSDTNINDIESLAYKTREFWDLNNSPIVNMVHLLESNGIIISGMNVDKKGATIFTQKQRIGKEVKYLISLGNDKKSASIRNYDLAYELGYIVSSELRIPNKQFSADEYACAFLLPKESFLEDLIHPEDIDYYVELKKKWIVPMSAMLFRAYNLGKINYKKYNYLMNEMEKKGWLREEPLDKMKGSSPMYLKRAVELLIENKIMSTNSIVSSLEEFGINLYPEDLELLMGLKKGLLSQNINKKSKVIKFDGNK